MTKTLTLALAAAALLLAGCETAYYSAMESVGFAKRDILASRVEAARDSQQAAKEEITDALTEFGRVVSYQGGDLEAQYRKLAAQLEDGEEAAAAVRARIRDVENVAEALFDEWQDELAQYSSANLRTQSEKQLRETRARYATLIGAMKRAESRLEPALQPLRDQVLFLKHNLNARAIAGLQGEVARVDVQVNQLVAELNAAIAEANRFIADLERNGG
jgi:chromosome segregation ATPase